MALDREKTLARRARYRAKNREKIRAYGRQWKKNNPTTSNESYKRLYGITEEDYLRMLKEQNEVCKICLKPETAKAKDKVKRLSVDHCHMTGKVRGLLCHKCNTTLGKYEDNIETFERFIEYLSAFSPTLGCS